MSYGIYPPPFSKEGMNEPNKRQKDFCARSRKLTHQDDTPDSLLPDDSTTYDPTISMKKADIDNALAVLSNSIADTAMILPVVYGCVNYRDSFSNVVHQSQFMYDLGPVQAIPGYTVPLSRLQVLEWPDGGKQYD
jgi:hypothetical protein